MRAEPSLQPTLIYDGECEFCCRVVGLLTRWDRERRLAFVAFQDQARVAKFGIALPALTAAMHLVLPDGRVLAGADAAPELLRLLPGKRWMVPLFKVPGVMALSRGVYAWVARRRHCLVRGHEAP